MRFITKFGGGGCRDTFLYFNTLKRLNTKIVFTKIDLVDQTWNYFLFVFIF